MSGWGEQWFDDVRFSAVNARRVADQEPDREAQAARRAVHRALWVAALVVLVLFVAAWLT